MTTKNEFIIIGLAAIFGLLLPQSADAYGHRPCTASVIGCYRCCVEKAKLDPVDCRRECPADPRDYKKSVPKKKTLTK